MCPDAPRVSPWCVLAPRSVFTALRRAQDRVEPIRRRALPFKAESVLDPGRARAVDDGRGAGAFRAHIAAHTAPTCRAARAQKAPQPWGQTLNGTVRAMLGAGAGGALGLCRACTHGLGTPLGRETNAGSGAATAQPPVPPLRRRTIRKRTPPDWRTTWPSRRRCPPDGRQCGWMTSRRASCPLRRANCTHAPLRARCPPTTPEDRR